MKNKEIEQAEKELSEIEAMQPGDAESKIIDFLRNNGIHQIRKKAQSQAEWIEQMFSYAHTFLQTKMMLNACTTARSSCKWAAIAATVAALGVVLGCYTYLFKMIILMFKSIFCIFEMGSYLCGFCGIFTKSIFAVRDFLAPDLILKGNSAVFIEAQKFAANNLYCQG